MTAFDFISHEKFPEDPYTKEAVCLSLEGKYRVMYVRKRSQSGGMFWDVISAGVLKDGAKKYLKAFSQDSNFLSADIKHFLDSRGWEKKQTSQNYGKSQNEETLPF